MLSQKDEQQEMDEKQQGKNACYLKAADENWQCIDCISYTIHALYRCHSLLKLI
jgi:hypothetical protein